MQNTFTPNINDTFIAMFTHDLKTPINSGIYALEMILNDKSNPINSYHREILNDILNSEKYMKNLTENMLCKYKSDNGHLDLNKEKCNFTKLVKNCISDMSYIVNEKKQTLIFNAPEEDIFINADILNIKRVINNLISNASKYSKTSSKILVTLEVNKNNAIFQVQDFGYGIEINNLSKVFDKYVRLANKQKTSGTGLGLYVAKVITDAHKGSIDIKSKKDYGTTVTIKLPLISKKH